MARRFLIFFIGVVISSLFIYYSHLKGTGSRYFIWTWEERVKESLRLDSNMFLEPSFECLLDCNAIVRADIDSLLVHGEVAMDGAAGEKDTVLYLINNKGLDQDKLLAAFRWIRSKDTRKLMLLKKGNAESNPCDCL